jgi:hypothetical protein
MCRARPNSSRGVVYRNTVVPICCPWWRDVHSQDVVDVAMQAVGSIAELQRQMVRGPRQLHTRGACTVLCGARAELRAIYALHTHVCAVAMTLQAGPRCSLPDFHGRLPPQCEPGL